MVRDGSAEKCFQMKEDGGLFSRLVAKEASIANSSSRVMYYGEASVGVPFMWESKPGTPKHPLCSHSHTHTSLPSLTPPPSYNSNHSNPNPKNHKKSNNKAARIFTSVFRALLAGSGKVHVSPSSSSTWSSSSSFYSSSSLSLSSSSFSVRDRDEGILCFNDSKYRGTHHGFRGCAPFGNMRTVFLKIVGHGGAV